MENREERRLRLTRERVERWRARQSQETLSRLSGANAESQQQRQIQSTSNALEHRSPASEAYHQDPENQSQIIRAQSQNIDEREVTPHDCGPMNAICQFCGSKNFALERPSDGMFNSCCHKGKVKLEKPRDQNGCILEYPEFLQKLISDPNHPNYKNFRQHIRSYNSALSFASMGAKIVTPPGHGPYIFRVHGQIYHLLSSLHPAIGESRRFAQLYVLDSTQATTNRMNLPENDGCLPEIIHEIDRFIRIHNRIADSFRMLKDVEQEELRKAMEEGRQPPKVCMVMRKDRRNDQRRYNSPTANEIAMVFVNEDGEPPFERDIRIYPHSNSNEENRFTNINILSPNLDPMTYALLYPYGQPGWQPNWQMEGYRQIDGRKRNNVTMLQYKAAQTAIRTDFNPMINSGKLSQQWIVDSYLQVEANNLNFCRFRQSHLRTELYQGLADHMARDAAYLGVQAGVPVILPSSFEGSPRNMRERCNDAMAIFSKFGSIDLFVTVTANPSWSEIVANLRPGEVSADRPDIVARVFKLKLKAIIEDITVHGVLGNCLAYVYTIEFQKRGLPHAHILLVLKSEDKFKSATAIDRVVTAELPNIMTEPRLFEIVTRCMIHGPCGARNPNSPCMEQGTCKKQFPKEYQNETKVNFNGYPLYRRRRGTSAIVRGFEIDNSCVVPYNKYLLLKYNCHINVEICTSIKAVKYIYKYIYKGFDCANIEIREGEQNLQHDEIANFIDARYISACEAMWRLLESPMHGRSHSVVRLPVHLPNQHRIYFEDGHEQEALNEARSAITKLIAWFELNVNNVEAREYAYTDIPSHYIYGQGVWRPRQRGAGKIVTRMYTVGAHDQERFCLRLLLLHIAGATSFEYLRTVDGIVYETFKLAAFHRNLLSSDEEWEKCLEEAATFQMPFQMRQSFAFICVFCNPTNALSLWEKFKFDLALDFTRNHSNEDALNLALHDINFVFQQHNLNCAHFQLPEPTGNRIEQIAFDPVKEKEEALRLISTLNPQQLIAFQKIQSAIDSDLPERCFFLDGPGGSGKTYLYNTLMSFIRGKGEVVLPFATTGIAATLLKGGKTVHSGFKLPIPLEETSVSYIKMISPEADLLRISKLIIIDEVTMLSKHGLRCINVLLQEIMKNNLPFGGKVMVIGGDFRQTLPVVARGNESAIIEMCIKSCEIWQKFTQLTLITNMRSENQDNFNQWLLNIGVGAIASPEGYEGAITIPEMMTIEDNIIEAIFGENVGSLDVSDLSKRVILCPKNVEALDINNEIIQKLYGTAQIYYSSDSIISDDPNDERNYPVEFLHTLCPSGFPPHKLNLKKGAIVMLLRNLNPKKGLCNGTRLVVKECFRNTIIAEILSENHRGEIITIPRIDFMPSDVNLPFILKRRQFPIIPAFAMTINKCQGQTFDKVGIFLNEPVFSHGQLYVALSRSRNKENIKILIKPGDGQGKLPNNNQFYTRNVIFKQALE